MKKGYLTIISVLTFISAVTQAQPVFFGTTKNGGAHDHGVLYSFSPHSKVFAKVHDFDSMGGANPDGNLIQAIDGRLYGTAYNGGEHGFGTIFTFDPLTGTFKKLWDFDGKEGAHPVLNFFQTSDGKLYGTTEKGGSQNRGVIYSFDPLTGHYTKLFESHRTWEWVIPYMTNAEDGKLYGVFTVPDGAQNIFSFDPNTLQYEEFYEWFNQYSLGLYFNSPLLHGPEGKLYGSISEGGIYSIDPKKRVASLIDTFTFQDESVLAKGIMPYDLIMASDGKLYGKTIMGGANGRGTLFSFDPVTKFFIKLLDFDEASSIYKTGILSEVLDGIVYEVTATGGSHNHGFIHSFDLSTKTFTKLWDFDNINGRFPAGKMILYKATNTITTWYRDADGDGFGDSSNTKVAAIQPRGYVSNKEDCNDKNKVKGGPEVCDGIDNDCDGIIDDGLTETTFYSDFDGDGYGSNKRTITSCAAPPRFVAVSGDCNDDNNTVYPGAPELCDGRDNDCNGKLDDGLTLKPFYWDGDKDGYGFFRPVYACSAPPGHIAVGGDCNDKDTSIHLGAIEHCDGVDEDCDGIIDNGFVQKRFYKDRDGDGWGSNSNLMAGCAPAGYVEKSGDCDDYNKAVHPDAIEILGNKMDENCNGQVDEGVTTSVTLYGMTTGLEYDGGSGLASNGTIFSFKPADSTFVRWWDFEYNKTINSLYPYGSFVKATDGKLYGLAKGPGWINSNSGTIFSFDPNTAAYDIVWDFSKEGTEGTGPTGTLIQTTDGKLYGMSGGGTNGTGIIFSFEPITKTFSKLHDFDATVGLYPGSSLSQATDGNLYGVVNTGGDYNMGSIFSFDPGEGIYKKVFDFNGQTGANPFRSLLQASDGKLYGIAEGGTNNAGVIFSLNPATQKVAKLLDFNPSEGRKPNHLMQTSDGKLYGTTESGGTNNAGTIFSVDLVTGQLTKLWDFTEAIYSEEYPFLQELMQASDGNLYGLRGGGNGGILYSLDPVTTKFTKLRDFPHAFLKGEGVLVGHLIEYEPVCMIRYYQDKDEDGYGNNGVSVTRATCVPPEGYVPNNRDCNDNDASIHPQDTYELECDGLDNDCDGGVDEGAGGCEGVVTKAAKTATEPNLPALSLKVMPNPATSYFTLQISSNSNKPVQLRVIDAIGKVVEARQGIAPNSTVPIGHQYRPGVYYAEVLQDGTKATVKLVKAAPY